MICYECSRMAVCKYCDGLVGICDITSCRLFDNSNPVKNVLQPTPPIITPGPRMSIEERLQQLQAFNQEEKAAKAEERKFCSVCGKELGTNEGVVDVSTKQLKCEDCYYEEDE